MPSGRLKYLVSLPVRYRSTLTRRTSRRPVASEVVDRLAIFPGSQVRYPDAGRRIWIQPLSDNTLTAAPHPTSSVRHAPAEVWKSPIRHRRPPAAASRHIELMGDCRVLNEAGHGVYGLRGGIVRRCGGPGSNDAASYGTSSESHHTEGACASPEGGEQDGSRQPQSRFPPRASAGVRDPSSA
jgi:hypothetical protein